MNSVRQKRAKKNICNKWHFETKWTHIREITNTADGVFKTLNEKNEDITDGQRKDQRMTLTVDEVITPALNRNIVIELQITS